MVWSLEHFKYYLCRYRFELQTDQALLSALKNNRGNKTYQSRLIKWVDRLLPFTFKVSHIPGKHMGFADYFSIYPMSAAPPISESDNNFVINSINAITLTLQNAHRNSTNQNARNSSKYNYVMNNRKQNNKRKHAFSLNRYQNQSPLFSLL